LTGASTQNSKFIHAPPEALYRAFTDPSLLPAWLVPGDMTGAVNDFDLRVGGGYTMSLFYPPSQAEGRGKTAGREDRYTARFLELVPGQRLAAAITFHTSDPAYQGEMIMEVTLEPRDKGTWVHIQFTDIPPGIRPEDNEAGTRSSLDKLAHLVEGV
jgi:uncharacterized protein YndB with AHSA1/START domain